MSLLHKAIQYKFTLNLFSVCHAQIAQYLGKIFGTIYLLSLEWCFGFLIKQ